MPYEITALKTGLQFAIQSIRQLMLRAMFRYIWQFLKMIMFEFINQIMTCILLLKGANPNIANKSGVTPLTIAHRMGFKNVVDVLIKCGAIAVDKLTNYKSKSSDEEKQQLSNEKKINPIIWFRLCWSLACFLCGASPITSTASLSLTFVKHYSWATCNLLL